MTAPKQQEQPQVAMFQIISGFWISRGVFVIAKLGIPDILKSGPKTAAELASATDTHAESLFRVLRALVSVGVLASDNENRFSNTSVSETLVTDAPGSLRWFTISELGQEHYPAWGNLMHSVKTGEIAFDKFFGNDIWAYFRNNPEEATVFNNSMSGVTAALNESLRSLYDFSKFKTVVDVGGGHGGLITEILKSNPNAQGILFDAAEVINGSRERLAEAGLSDRCGAVAGDFFKAVPEGGDAYVMKWIIHDWDDERAIKILKNCRAQMGPDARLIIVDCVVPETNEPHFSKFIDLNMLVMTGGKERTAKEFARLLEASGFKLLQVIPTDQPTSIIEGQPI
ncbi:MAG TPA: methyltransferase [Pyrinomonadaceae bacterium]|jgi:O-methyltransferase.|nr:methyltransferase [Pyrinomonadaceae bacterium]